MKTVNHRAHNIDEIIAICGLDNTTDSYNQLWKEIFESDDGEVEVRSNLANAIFIFDCEIIQKNIMGYNEMSSPLQKLKKAGQ